MQIEYLKRREVYIDNLISNLPAVSTTSTAPPFISPFTYLSKLAHIIRTHVNDILNQYEAVFSRNSDDSTEKGAVFLVLK